MGKVDFEVIGMHEIDTKIDNLSKKQRALESDALLAGAEPIYRSILSKAPVRTGRGKSAIKIGKIRTLKGAKYISIGVHKDDREQGLHMYYQEFGTSRHKAQPHIRPGYEEQKANAFNIVRNMLKAGLGL